MNAQNRRLDFFFGQLHLIEGCLALIESLTFDSCRCCIQCKTIADNIRWSEILMTEVRREETADGLPTADLETFDEFLREIHYQLIIIRLQTSSLITDFPKKESVYRGKLALLRKEGAELARLRTRLWKLTAGRSLH